MKSTVYGSGLALVLFTSIASGATYNASFEGVNNTVIAQSLGDNSEANLSYRSLVSLGSDPAWGNIGSGGELWGWSASGYGDLTSAAWAKTKGSRGEIRIDATLPNSAILLNSFELGSWGTDQDASFYIFDGSWNMLASNDTLIAPSSDHLTVSPSVSSLDGTLILQWGDDAWSTGLNNLNYSVSSPNLSAVPIPAALWLFGTGVLGLVSLAKRKISA